MVVDGAGAARPRLVSRGLVLVFVAAFGALTSFYVLLSVVPLYATSVGAGEVGAGMATGALLFATVAGELASPRLVARFGYRSMVAAALLLLGAPAIALPAAHGVGAIVAVSVVRGLGFGVAVVVAAALVAVLVPGQRRGEGLGLYGVVVGVPSVVALPLGVWLAEHVGYPPVFVAGAVTALAGLAVVPWLPGREVRADAGPGGDAASGLGMLAALRAPALVRPSVAFAATAMAAGVVVAFVPLAVPSAPAELVAAALLVQALAATVSRWWAGRHGDRHGSARLLAPAVLAAGIGMLALVAIGSPVALMAAMVLFGTGFGVAQNASLASMLERVSTPEYGTVSAVWNLAYDAGMGLGAAGFGVLAVQTGYPVAFAVTAALVLAAVWPAWQRTGPHPAG